MKLIVLTSRFPFPLEKGDKLRIFNQIKVLSKNHEIHLLATSFYKVNQSHLDQLKPYCKTINVFEIGPLQQLLNLIRTLFTRLPFQVGLFYTKGIHRKINAIIQQVQPNAIYCHLIRMSEYVKDNPMPCPKTIDYMDVFSKGMDRRAQRSKGIMKQLILWEYRRLSYYENHVFDKFNHQTIISAQDRDFIPHPSKANIQIIENGVDWQEFYPMNTPKQYQLLFTGNMGYPPNIEAAIYCATKILPEIHQQHPNLKLLIAGISPSQAVRDLANQHVIVIDHFEHIRDAFAMSTINLAPMLTSIGLQNKILQAMAMKLPTICTTLANNAVKAIPGHQILVADDPKAYAAHIHQLLSNPSQYDSIAQQGYEFVKERFDWEKQNQLLEPLLFSNGTNQIINPS